MLFLIFRCAFWFRPLDFNENKWGLKATRQKEKKINSRTPSGCCFSKIFYTRTAPTNTIPALPHNRPSLFPSLFSPIPCMKNLNLCNPSMAMACGQPSPFSSHILFLSSTFQFLFVNSLATLNLIRATDLVKQSTFINNYATLIKPSKINNPMQTKQLNVKFISIKITLHTLINCQSRSG